MLIRYGYEMTIETDGPVPLITQMSARPEVQLQLQGIERFETTPGVPFSVYLDGFGNLCRRMTAPGGAFTMRSEATLAVSGLPEAEFPQAEQMPIEALPDDVLVYLMASRYCDIEPMMGPAWDLFGQVAPGWTRAQAVSDWAHGHLKFNYGDADATRTAFGAYSGGKGVCRDFAHLMIATCRALGMPARYVNAHLGDIGVPPVDDPMDFAASCEVYLSGRWWPFDPRNNQRRIGRIVIGYGRDAADVALMTSFGRHRLTGFKVITDEVKG